MEFEADHSAGALMRHDPWLCARDKVGPLGFWYADRLRLPGSATFLRWLGASIFVRACLDMACTHDSQAEPKYSVESLRHIDSWQQSPCRRQFRGDVRRTRRAATEWRTPSFREADE